jgi:hypothetical protein
MESCRTKCRISACASEKFAWPRISTFTPSRNQRCLSIGSTPRRLHMITARRLPRTGIDRTLYFSNMRAVYFSNMRAVFRARSIIAAASTGGYRPTWHATKYLPSKPVSGRGELNLE